jgi:hypothetical protein
MLIASGFLYFRGADPHYGGYAILMEGNHFGIQNVWELQNPEDLLCQVVVALPLILHTSFGHLRRMQAARCGCAMRVKGGWVNQGTRSLLL